MLLLTLGTHEQSFERAVDLIEPVARGGERVVVQHGATRPRTGVPNAAWRAYMEYDELRRLMSAARVVVCHAGVGTIMTALQLGVRPVVLSRRPELGEHVDDHQSKMAERLAALGLIVHHQDGPLTAALELLSHAPQSSGTVTAGLGQEVARLADLPPPVSRWWR